LGYESIGSFKNGFILMAGLFLYDIFWVFGTEVMVKVATGVKGPIKFVFPKALPAPNEYTREYYSMLGLGDVVVPGFFIAFLLAFDAYNARKEGKDTLTSADWKKPYFHTCCVFYALALLATVVVMLYFKHAQVMLGMDV
jgi:singapore isolate B (sub-type 7) whole genome shotgun sequence assembly, scaffold_0